MFLLRFWYGFCLLEHFVCANALCVCVQLTRGLKLLAKHYDLLKIYTKNTLQTDKNRLQTTSIYVNQIVCGRTDMQQCIFTSFNALHFDSIWINSLQYNFQQSRLLIPFMYARTFTHKCNATSPDNQSVFDSVLVRAMARAIEWIDFKTKHSGTLHTQPNNYSPFSTLQ